MTMIMVFSLTLVAQASEIKVLNNGEEKSFNPAPIIKNGSTLVPMRGFFEALGCEVEWDNETRTAIGRRDGIEVKLPIGNSVATVNGRQKQLAVAAQLIKGSTFIPLRFVGEALGEEVVWDNGTILITSKETKNETVVKEKAHVQEVNKVTMKGKPYIDGVLVTQNDRFYLNDEIH